MGKRVWRGLHAEEVPDRTFVMAIDSTTLTNDKPYMTPDNTVGVPRFVIRFEAV